MERTVEVPVSLRPLRTASLFGETPHDAEGRPSVPRSEVVPVVQVVEELVQLQTLLKAGGPGDLTVVGRVEGAAEAPKHAGDCQLILRVAVERSWVKNDGPRGVLGYVSSPQVPMEQGWDDVQATEQLRDLQLQGGNSASAKRGCRCTSGQGSGSARTPQPPHGLAPPPPIQTKSHSGLWGLQGTAGLCSPVEQTTARGPPCPQTPSPPCPSGAECAAGHRTPPSPSASCSPAQATAKDKARADGWTSKCKGLDGVEGVGLTGQHGSS